MSDDLTTQVQQWQSVRAAGLIPEQWVTDAIVNDLLEKVQELEREVANMADTYRATAEGLQQKLSAAERELRTANTQEEISRIRAKAAEASLAAIRELAESQY